jgi:hypothetical protein
MANRCLGVTTNRVLLAALLEDMLKGSKHPLGRQKEIGVTIGVAGAHDASESLYRAGYDRFSV